MRRFFLAGAVLMGLISTGCGYGHYGYNDNYRNHYYRDGHYDHGGDHYRDRNGDRDDRYR